MQDSKINILYLSYDGMTDPLGQSQVIPYLEGLSKQGYSFTLISFEKKGRFDKFSAEISARLKQSGIDWVPLSYTKNPPVLSTLWDLRRMERKAFQLHREKNFKVIHCRSYISSLVGLKMKRQLGVKFIFDMRGFYADERVDGGIWNLSNPVLKSVYNYFKTKEKEFLTEADYTISLTQKAKDIIHTWKEIPNQPVPIQVIPCCADLELFSEKSIDKNLLQKLRQQFNLTGNEFVLSYLGSVGTWYLLDEMLGFFNCLLESRPDAKFIFITGEDPQQITQKAKVKGIPESSILVTSAPHKNVPTYLALSSCSIFFIKPVFSKSASSPTKQGEIMGMGIPYICNDGVGDVSEIARKSETGFIVEELNNPYYYSVIEKVLSVKPDKVKIEASAKQFYSLTEGVKKYDHVYKLILKNG